MMLSGVKMRMEPWPCSLFIDYTDHGPQWDKVREQEIGREGMQVGLLLGHVKLQVSCSDNLHELGVNLQLNLSVTV